VSFVGPQIRFVGSTNRISCQSAADLSMVAEPDEPCESALCGRPTVLAPRARHLPASSHPAVYLSVWGIVFVCFINRICAVVAL
jgi:hypothetical protein